jgi:hypothetical protein
MFLSSLLSDSVELEMLIIVIQFISQILGDCSAFCCSISLELKRMGARPRRSFLLCRVFHFSSENGKSTLLSTLQASLMSILGGQPATLLPTRSRRWLRGKVATPMTKVTCGITPAGSLHEIRDGVGRSLLHPSLDCFFPPLLQTQMT